MRPPTRAYQVFAVRRLDLQPGEVVSSPREQVLVEHPDNDEPPASTILLTGAAFSGYSHLHLTHEDVKEKQGRTLGRSFKRAIYKEDMEAYYHAGLKVLVVNGSHHSARGCLQRLGSKPEVIEVAPMPVNLMTFLEEVRNTKGAWLTGLPMSGNVTTVGLFGDHVDLSGDFDKYRSLGTLSALTVELIAAREARTFQVTRNGTVVFYGPGDVYTDLTFLNAIYRKMYPHLGGEEGSTDLGAASQDGLFPEYRELPPDALDDDE